MIEPGSYAQVTDLLSEEIVTSPSRVRLTVAEATISPVSGRMATSVPPCALAETTPSISISSAAN